MTAFPKISKNLSRRGFIGASALAPAALMLQAGEAHAPASTRAQLAAVHSGSPAHQLLYKTDEFFIAHRGAGNISPEHTPYTYAESVSSGALAVEISVRTTSDGQFVCNARHQHQAHHRCVHGRARPHPRNTMKLRQKVTTGQVVNCKVERAGEGA